MNSTLILMLFLAPVILAGIAVILILIFWPKQNKKTLLESRRDFYDDLQEVMKSHEVSLQVFREDEDEISFYFAGPINDNNERFVLLIEDIYFGSVNEISSMETVK